VKPEQRDDASLAAQAIAVHDTWNCAGGGVTFRSQSVRAVLSIPRSSQSAGGQTTGGWSGGAKFLDSYVSGESI